MPKVNHRGERRELPTMDGIRASDFLGDCYSTTGVYMDYLDAFYLLAWIAGLSVVFMIAGGIAHLIEKVMK